MIIVIFKQNKPKYTYRKAINQVLGHFEKTKGDINEIAQKYAIYTGKVVVLTLTGNNFMI